MELEIKPKEKVIKIVTICIMLLVMILFEIGYCNAAWLKSIFYEGGSQYNFSICRIVFYIIFLLLYIIFKNKFLQEAIEALENKVKNNIIYFATIILFLAIIIAICIMVKEPSLIRIATVVIISFLLGYLFILYISNNPIKNVIVIVCTFGILFSITTTFNNQIDEKRHFMTAFNISFLNFDYIENPITDKQIEKLPRMMRIIGIDSFLEKKYTPQITNEVNKEQTVSIPADYNAFLYIFPAIGITIARFLGGSIIDIYIVGRIFNLILYTILIIIALKIIPFKKNIITVIAMMPFILLLAASYSIDGYCIGVVFIFIAYCLKLYKEKQEINLKQFLILCGLFILVLFAKKMSYMFVATIVLILPILKTIKKNKKYIPIMIAIAIISIVVMTVLLFYIKDGLKGDNRANGYTNPTEQIQYMLENPIHNIELIINQIKRTIFNFDWWSMLHYYVLFTNDAKYVALPLLLFILYVSLTEDDFCFEKKNKVIMTLSFIMVYITTTIPLYLSYTKVGELYVVGYQTRYIVPIMPLILFSLSSNKLKYKKTIYRTMNITFISGLFLFIGILQLISI